MDFGVKEYEVTLKGSSPLIWNVIQKELEDEKKELKKNELFEWEEKNWKRKAEFNATDKVVIPDRWVKSLLKDSAMRTRLVPHFATRKNETYTYYVGSFRIAFEEKGFDKNLLEYFGAYVGARGKNSDTKIWRVRPMVSKWNAIFSITDPAGRMNIKELKALLEYGGMFVGIGDNRINNYGRFEVMKITERRN